MAYSNYNYLDHLEDVEIDLSSYLTLFSDTNYTLEFSNLQSVKTNVKNLFSYIDVVDDFKDKAGAFKKYTILENELPEDVAIKFYGSEDFWWAITLYNNIDNPFTQWPLTNDQIDYLAGLYETKENKYTKEAYKLLLEETSLNKTLIDVLNPLHLADLIYRFQNSILVISDDNSHFRIL